MDEKNAGLGAPNVEKAAAALAGKAAKAIGAEPLYIEAHQRELYDLNFALVKEAAVFAKGQGQEDRQGFLLALAEELPPFESASFYEKRSTLAALAAAVLLGWLAGGLISGLLGFIGLGGDILRAAAIFAALWLEEYLGANPRARRILLAALGLGAGARVAASAAFSFTGFSAFRTAILGRAASLNIFKKAWLVAGAFFVFVFFAKKITSLNLGALEASLEKQTAERMRLVIFILDSLEEGRGEARAMDDGALRAELDTCQANSRALARGALELMDSLEPNRRAWLAGLLERLGYAPGGGLEDERIFTWDGARHGDLYEPVGLIRDGDTCVALRRPAREGDKIVKGHAQKI